MKNIKFLALIIIIFISGIVKATGLLMPTSKTYPKNFLRLKSSVVSVNIHGVIAETIVYQEFVNEWTDSTGAVYSFPLPADARATKFLYWYNDKWYEAVLKVKEQVTNPGTGEGGVAALVNNYIGSNGIKIELKNIKAGEIQKVELHYVSMCDYFNGKCSYTFPLNTAQFVTHPLDYLNFTINVSSSSGIKNYASDSHDGFQVLKNGTGYLSLGFTKSKEYINKDLSFYYETEPSSLGVDFYSVAGDTSGGHFVLVAKPRNRSLADSICPKRMIFLLSNSSAMYGSKLSQSIAAISKSLDMLNGKDLFNIVLFNSITTPWKPEPIAATAENIQAAKSYLSSVTISYGSVLNTAITECLKQMKDKSYNNSIILFANGRSMIDPKAIAAQNINKAGIFPVGIGPDLDRSRLEMLARLNYGFVTYVPDNESMTDKMVRVFQSISHPVISDVKYEYGKVDINQVMPATIPSVYAGSYFFMTGRYKKTGQSILSIAGMAVNKTVGYDFRLDYSASSTVNKFAESIWAKEMIDDIERQIDVYGETPELKKKDIEISLKYGIRCRYTSYIADYTTVHTAVEKGTLKESLPTSFIAGNYPNPFNPETRIRIFIGSGGSGSCKLIRIYNILGQLVRVIDISGFSEGWKEVSFDGRDMQGNLLPSGTYIVQLQIEGKHIQSLKVNLLK